MITYATTQQVHDLELFYLSPVAEAEVDKIMSNFKDSAAGWDELKPSIIETVKDSIKIPLAHIGNLSFDTGIFPVELKIIGRELGPSGVSRNQRSRWKHAFSPLKHV